MLLKFYFIEKIFALQIYNKHAKVGEKSGIVTEKSSVSGKVVKQLLDYNSFRSLVNFSLRFDCKLLHQ